MNISRNGIVGGQLLSFAALTCSAGQMGVRILAGEMPQRHSRENYSPACPWLIGDNCIVGALTPQQSCRPELRLFSYKELSWPGTYTSGGIVGAISLVVLQSLADRLGCWFCVLGAAARLRFASERFALARQPLEHKRLEAVVANVPGVGLGSPA